MPVNFYATGLNKSLTSSAITSSAFTSAAVATIDVTLNDIADIFSMQSTDSTGSKLQFYVDKTKFNTNLILTNAVMTASDAQDSIFSDNNYFAEDYLRFVAKQIFGDTNGTNLFTNNSTVISGINNAFSSNYNELLGFLDMNNINNNTTTTHIFNGTSFTMSMDLSGNYFLDNTETGSHNIVYTLFKQLEQSDSSRATSFLGNANQGKQTFPFDGGDTITIFLTIKPNSLQYITSDGYSQIDNKTYAIQVNVI
jgi:hypothetical protein